MGSGASVFALESNIGAADFAHKLQKSAEAHACREVVSAEVLAQRDAARIEFQEEQAALRLIHGSRRLSLAVMPGNVQALLDSSIKAAQGKSNLPVIGDLPSITYLDEVVPVIQGEKKSKNKVTKKDKAEKKNKAATTKTPKSTFVPTVFDRKELLPGTAREIVTSGHEINQTMGDYAGVFGALRDQAQIITTLNQQIKSAGYSDALATLNATSRGSIISEGNLPVLKLASSSSRSYPQVFAAIRAALPATKPTETAQVQIGQYKCRLSLEKDPETKEPIIVAAPPSKWEALCWLDGVAKDLDHPQGHENSLAFMVAEITYALQKGFIDEARIIVPFGKIHKPVDLLPGIELVAGMVILFKCSLLSTRQVGVNGICLPRSQWLGEKGSVKKEAYNEGTKIWTSTAKEASNFELVVTYRGEGLATRSYFWDSGKRAISEACKLIDERVGNIWQVLQVKIYQRNEEVTSLVDPFTGKTTSILTLTAEKVAKLMKGSTESQIVSPEGVVLKEIGAIPRDAWKDPGKHQIMTKGPSKTNGGWAHNAKRYGVEKGKK